MITRRSDWPERLYAVVEAAKAKPFVWGEHDCALFACDCAKAMTGYDFAHKFRGRYRTARGGSMALWRIEGVRSLAELADKYLGPRIIPSLARRGDAVMVEIIRASYRHALGVCLGAEAAYPGLNDLMFLPVGKATAAWPVGWGG